MADKGAASAVNGVAIPAYPMTNYTHVPPITHSYGAAAMVSAGTGSGSTAPPVPTTGQLWPR